MRNWVEDFDPTENDIRLLTSGPVAPPGLSSEELGGAYITVSQQGSEREHRQHATTGGAATAGSAPASP
jgi:GTPase-activating protein SST2